MGAVSSICRVRTSSRGMISKNRDVIFPGFNSRVALWLWHHVTGVSTLIKSPSLPCLKQHGSYCDEASTGPSHLETRTANKETRQKRPRACNVFRYSAILHKKATTHPPSTSDHFRAAPPPGSPQRARTAWPRKPPAGRRPAHPPRRPFLSAGRHSDDCFSFN